MHLILVSYRRLHEQYGPQGHRRLTQRIAELQQARTARGLGSKILGVESGSAALGVGGADARDPQALREQILAVDTALQRQGQRLASVLLVGGPSVLPFQLCPNPLPDSDGLVPSDYPYGQRDANQLLTDWPVSRLPAGSGDDPSDLLRLLLLATFLQRWMPLAADKAVGYSTALWQHAARQVYSAVADPAALLVSPPLQVAGLSRSVFDGARWVYVNLHGVKDGPVWYGQAADRRRSLVTALRPQDVEQLRLTGALVVSEACYGAYSTGFDLGDGLALRFLSRGAAGFVGATTIAYGSARPPLAAADRFAQALLAMALQPGISLGEAFHAARWQTISTLMTAQGFLDEEDIKTLTQFVLYGDPTIIIGCPE